MHTLDIHARHQTQNPTVLLRHTAPYTHTPSGSCTTPLVNEALYRQMHNAHTHTHTQLGTQDTKLQTSKFLPTFKHSASHVSVGWHFYSKFSLTHHHHHHLSYKFGPSPPTAVANVSVTVRSLRIAGINPLIGKGTKPWKGTRHQAKTETCPRVEATDKRDRMDKSGDA